MACISLSSHFHWLEGSYHSPRGTLFIYWSLLSITGWKKAASTLHPSVQMMSTGAELPRTDRTFSRPSCRPTLVDRELPSASCIRIVSTKGTIQTRSIWKMLGPFTTASRRHIVIHQVSLLSHAACALMSTTTTTTTTTTTRDRGDR